MEGYIKLYRKFRDWEWYKDQNTKAVFIHLCLMANFMDGKWKGLAVKRGQTITSIKHIAEDTGLTEQQVRTAIKHLKSTSELTSKSTKGATLITIENYDKYQGEFLEITRDVTKDITSEQQTPNIRLTNDQRQYKNDKNNKKENNSIKIENEGRSEISDEEQRRRLLAGCKDHIVPDALSDMHRLWIESIEGGNK